jgi:hypothetical protein
MSKQPRPPPTRGRRGTVNAIAEKRSKDVADAASAEDTQRKAIIAAFAAEREAVFVTYDEESRKVKDSLISILEKRLYAVRSSCAAVVAESESSLESILQGTTRLLLDCHRAGMLVVQKLEQISDATTPAGSSSLLSGQAAAVAQSRVSPPPPTTGGTPVLASSSAPAFCEGLNKIASVVAQPPSSGSSTPASLPPIATSFKIHLVEDEQRIIRFFNSELPENKLTARGGRDLCRRLEELSFALTSLLEKSLAKLRTAHARIEHLERALNDEVIQRVSCEKMLGDFLVRGRSESDRVIERCRELLATFEGRMEKIEREARGDLQEFIKQGAEAALARAKRQDDPFSVFKFESNAITDGYLTTLDKTRALHQQLLRDIELRMLEFSSEPIRKGDLSEVGKLFRSGLPADCRRVLECEELFDRASLLRLVEHLSFEPRSCEVATALIREFKSYLEESGPGEAASLLCLSAGTQQCQEAGAGKGDGSAAAVAKSSAVMAAVPVAHVVPPCTSHLVCVDSNTHSIVPRNLYLTPFNKFWIDKMEAEERTKKVRLQTARNAPDDNGLELPSSLTPLQRRELVLRYVGDGGAVGEAAGSESSLKHDRDSIAKPSTGASHQPPNQFQKGALAAMAVASGKQKSSSAASAPPANRRAPTAPTDSMGALAKAFSVKQRQLIEQLSSS